MIFLPQSHRDHGEKFVFGCREIPTTKKLLPHEGVFWPKARGIMENRYLPILHKQTLLCVLRVSSESCLRRDERVVDFLS
jgi:hypothetical protein